MADPESLLTARLPSRLRKLGIPFAAVLLTSFFILIGFPYHHITNRAAASAAASLGVEIEAEDSGFTIGLDGPGFRFSDIEVVTPTGDTYPLDTLRFGPAWSLSWFMLEPVVFFEVASTLGHAEGKVGTGDSPSLQATVRDAMLTDLRFLEETLPIKITGTMSADAAIESKGDAYSGPITFDLKDGELGNGELPVEIAYDTIHGEAILGGEQFLNVAAFDLLGPMFNVSISGNIGNGATNEERPIDMNVVFTEILSPLRPTIEGLGAKLAADGTARIHIGGTLAAPVFK